MPAKVCMLVDMYTFNGKRVIYELMSHMVTPIHYNSQYQTLHLQELNRIACFLLTCFRGYAYDNVQACSTGSVLVSGISTTCMEMFNFVL